MLWTLLLACALLGRDTPDPTPDPAPDPVVEPRPDVGKAGKAKAGKAGKAGKAKAGKAGGVDLPGDVPEITLAFNNAQSAVYTRDGAFHAIWQDHGDVRVSRTVDGRATERTLDTGECGLIALATDGDMGLVAMWQGDRSIRAAVSSDGGVTWGAAQTVSAKPGAGPAARVWSGADGALQAVLIWQLRARGGDKDTGPVTLWTSSYRAGGWSEPQRVDSGTAVAAWGTLVGHGPTTRAYWRDNRGGDGWRVYTAELENPGARWVREQDTGLVGLDPGACVDAQGVTHIGFHRDQSVWVTHGDGVADWAPPTRLDRGLFAQLSCTPDRVVVTYERLAGEGAWFDASIKTVGLAVSEDGGRTFERVPVDGDELGRSRASTCLDPEGELDVLYIQDDAVEHAKVDWQ